MKLISLITHPVLVVTLFCLTLVSGQHFGGFYLLYIILALPHGGIHAVLALLGIGTLLFSYGRYQRQSKVLIEPLLNVLGVLLLYLSLYLFFLNSLHYNSATFEQPIPILSYVLFGVVSLGFLLYSTIRFGRQQPDTSRAY